MTVENKNYAPYVVEHLVNGRGNRYGKPLKWTVLARDEQDAANIVIDRANPQDKIRIVKVYRTSFYD